MVVFWKKGQILNFVFLISGTEYKHFVFPLFRILSSKNLITAESNYEHKAQSNMSLTLALVYE